jgi:hypothetical protein
MGCSDALPWMIYTYRTFVNLKTCTKNNPLGKRRRRRRWVDNIRMDLGEVGWGDMDWIGLAKDRNR